MSAVKPLRKVQGEHDFSLCDDFTTSDKCITQTRYFKAGNIVVAIGELNDRNTWDDTTFDAACKFLTTSWNGARGGGK